MSDHEYSQGICGDGAAILKDGQPMTIEEIVDELRKGQAARAQGGQGAEVVAKVDHGCNREIRWLMSEDELERLPQGMNLYTQPQPEGDTLKQAARYRWLRDNKHLDVWWSVEGPSDRCDNIDRDIDEAMAQSQRPEGGTP